jgi:hypothetical protein
VAQVNVKHSEHAPKLIDRLLIPSEVAVAPVDLGQQLLGLGLRDRSSRMPWGSMTTERRNCSNSHGFAW